MHLVHEVLDKQMLDSRARKMGKVDGLVLELSGREQPRVICLEAGVPTLAERLSFRLGAWAGALVKRLSPERPGSYRVPWPKVQQIALDVHVDVDAEQAPVLALERWLRKRIVERLPGGRRGAT